MTFNISCILPAKNEMSFNVSKIKTRLSCLFKGILRLNDSDSNENKDCVRVLQILENFLNVLSQRKQHEMTKCKSFVENVST